MPWQQAHVLYIDRAHPMFRSLTATFPMFQSMFLPLPEFSLSQIYSGYA